MYFIGKNVLFCPPATVSNESFDLEKDINIFTKQNHSRLLQYFLKFSKDILDPELILFILIYSIVIFSISTLYV